MNETIIQRVAKAMREADCKRYEDQFPNLARSGAIRTLSEKLDEDYIVMARAAIEAMREPTIPMLEEGPPYPYMDKEVWAKMIDAALSEGEGS